MTVTHWTSAAAAAAFAAGFFAMAPAPAQAACKPDITRGADGRIQFTTRLTARNRWRAAARAKYGVRFATWTRADRKTEDCKKRQPSNRWNCVASARPCD